MKVYRAVMRRPPSYLDSKASNALGYVEYTLGPSGTMSGLERMIQYDQGDRARLIKVQSAEVGTWEDENG